MPRRTPVRELLKEEPVPNSPLRRSSRINNSSPVPTKVVSRRNSATEASVATPKATRSRRASLSQDQESEATEVVDVDKKTVKTPRTRRASLTASIEEEETVTKGKTGSRAVTPDPKKPVTRRRRSTSQDPEVIEEEPVKKATRSRSTSASKSGETVEDAKSKTNGHTDIDEEIDELDVEESKSSVPKKKKLDTLKIDLDLSVIKEGSFIEDEGATSTIEDKETEKVQDMKDTAIGKKEDASGQVEEKKSKPVAAVVEKEKVATKDVKEKATEENGPLEDKTSVKETKDTTKRKPVVENSSAEKTPELIVVIEKSNLATKKISEDLDTTKEKPAVESSQIKETSNTEEKSSIDAKQLEVSKDVEEKLAAKEGQAEAKSESTIMKENCTPAIEETEAAKEEIEDNIEKQKSESNSNIEEKTASTTKEKEDDKEKLADDQIEEGKFDSPSILKENSSVIELSDASFSDTSFHLQLSASVLDDINKTDGNISPTSNKENVRPQQKPEEPAAEPMDVDESYAEIPSPSKIARKSVNATKVALKLDEVEKKLEIAEKVTDEIAQFLTEEIHPSEPVPTQKTDIPKIFLTISETTEDSSKETTVDMSTVEYEKPIKEVNDISLKESQVTQQVEENSKEKSVEKEASDVTPAKDAEEESKSERLEANKTVEVVETTSDALSDSNISLIDEESTNLNKTQEDSSSEEKKEDAETSPENEDESVGNLSVSLNESDFSIQKTTECPQEKTVEQSTLETSSVEKEDCKQESSRVESAKIQEEVIVNPATTEESGEVAPGDTVQKEEAEHSLEHIDALSCSLGGNVSATADEKEVQECSVKEKNTSEELKPNEKTSEVAESQASDVEKKEVEDSEEEIVVDDEVDIVGYGEKEDNANLDQTETSTALEGNKEITISSPVVNKSETEDNEDSSFVIKTVQEETSDEPMFVRSHNSFAERAEIEVRQDIYEPVMSSREIVILSDDEIIPEDEFLSEEEVEFVREDLDPTVVKVSPRDGYEVNIQESLTCEKVNSLNSSKSWVDKTTFVMQETLRAEEDKETSLRDRIHKVVDLFCSEIKNKGDISINVSLECTGQNSDVSDHESSVKHDSIVAEPSVAEEQRHPVLKGSKRRKLHHSQNYDIAMFSENTSEDTIRQSEDKTSQKKKKKRELKNKKTSGEQVQSREESENQAATTSVEIYQVKQTSPKKKNKKQKSSSSAESHNEQEIPPKKKSKKQKSANVTESHEEQVFPTKKAKKRKDVADKIEVIENNQDKNKKHASKTKNKRHLDKEIVEEKKDMIPNKNENLTESVSAEEEEEEAYCGLFSRYFSTSLNSEDENDVTYQPSRDLNSSESDLITDEYDGEYTSCEELGETEESFSCVQKKDKKEKTTENKRLLYSSEDNADEGAAAVDSNSDDVFMDGESNLGKNKKQDTSKSGNKKPKEKSKQKRQNEQSDISDEGMLQSSLKKGKKLKQSEDTTVETSPNSNKKHKKRTRTYILSDEDDEFVPERKVKKEKSSPFKPPGKVEEKISPAKTKKVPNAKIKVGKKNKSNKKNFKLKPSIAAASGWDVETV